jgi:hypothetical protein
MTSEMKRNHLKVKFKTSYKKKRRRKRGRKI